MRWRGWRWSGNVEAKMNYDRLWEISEKATKRRALTADERKFVAEVIPRELAAFPRLKLPARVKHPAGFGVSGAVVGTFVRCALVLSAQKALGRRYSAVSEFYDRVERDLAMGIMRSHFHHGYPKGTHCCVQCSLAVYPVLKAKAIRWFDCGPLEKSVRGMIQGKEWRFSQGVSPVMVEWALG